MYAARVDRSIGEGQTDLDGVSVVGAHVPDAQRAVVGARQHGGGLLFSICFMPCVCEK